MKAFVPTGDPAEPVVLADVPEPRAGERGGREGGGVLGQPG